MRKPSGVSSCEKLPPSMSRSKPRWDVWVSSPSGDAAAAATHRCYSQSGADSSRWCWGINNVPLA